MLSPFMQGFVPLAAGLLAGLALSRFIADPARARIVHVAAVAALSMLAAKPPEDFSETAVMAIWFALGLVALLTSWRTTR